MSKINRPPVLTSQNYGINYYDFDDNLLNFKSTADFKINMQNDTNSQIEFCNIKHTEFPKNTIYPNFDTISQKKYGYAKKITFNHDTKLPFVLKFENVGNSTFASSLLFEVKENVRAQFVVEYSGNDTSSQISTIKIVQRKNSFADVIVLNKTESSIANLLSLETEQFENSIINLNVVEFACVNSVQSVKVNLVEDAVKSVVNTLYVGAKKDELSLNYIANIQGKKCQASIEALGLIFDECNKNFVGTINFEKGATKSVGEENEFCFLLSKKAKAKSTPILLSNEDDAVGKHSSAVGSIDPKKLFYANTRGLSKKDATKMFVKAKISKFLQNIFEENLKAKIDEYIDGRLEDENK